MSVHVRVCRECGEEYRPHVVRCADCGGELEDRHEGEEDGRTAAVAEHEPPPAERSGHRALFVTPRAADLVPMAERLRQTQVEYRLAEQPGSAEGAPPRYALLVPDEAAALALRALADLLAPHEPSEGVSAVETRFDAERGYVACPACGARTAPGLVECPECGLGLGGPEGKGEEPRD
jgi:ribosomal protein L32